jgi:hypothetical protein
MMKTLVLVLLLISATAAMHPPSQRTNRLPLQKKHIVLQAPKNYAQRFLGMDRDTGKETYYDPRPEVVLLDEKRGKYAFKWIGYDGKEKTVIYQRPDAINAVVSARLETTGSGNSTYTYTIENLQSSGEELTSYFVQNFASGVRTAKAADVYVGSVSRNDKEFKDGQWIGYGILNSSVVPGRSMEFRLESSALPGLVECRVAGGPRGMKGVGEDMPQELENMLPGYEAWPSGFTIGPIDNLKTLSPAERANYLLRLLPKFKELGWITAGVLRWYEQNLNRTDPVVLYDRADQDLKAGNITTEVFAMIHAIKQ